MTDTPSPHPTRGIAGVHAILDDLEDVPTTGDPQRDRVVRALYAIEQKVGQPSGWDAEPSFMALVMVAPGIVGAGMLPTQAWIAPGIDNAGDALITLAERYPEPPRPAPPALRQRVDHGTVAGSLVGFAVMLEGWGPYRHRRNPLPEVASAHGMCTHQDVPERMEFRSITAVDVNGYDYCLMRMRETDQVHFDHGDDPTLRGNITRSLYRLTTAALAGSYVWDRL